MSRFIRGFEKISLISILLSIIIFFADDFYGSSPGCENKDVNLTHVHKIVVVMDGVQKEEDTKQIIPLKEGEPFSPYRVSQSIKQLFKTGLFSDIKVQKEGEREVRLTYILSRNFFVRKISFLTSLKVSPESLKRGISSLREGGSFSEHKLKRATEELVKVLNEQGYFDPKIDTLVNKDHQAFTLDIVFNILFAKVFAVEKIFFSGEILVREEELKRKMETREGSSYVPSVVEEDLQRLRDFYNEMNFRRAEIRKEKVEFDEEASTVILNLRVIPHEKIEFIISGAEIPLNLLAPIWEERIFEEWGLDEGEAKIINYLRKKGYLFVRVESSLERKEQTIYVRYKISKGDKYVIEDIVFEGLEYFSASDLKELLGIKKKIPFFSWIDGARVFELPGEIVAFYKTRGFPGARVNMRFEKEKKGVRVIYSIHEGLQQKIGKLKFEGAKLFTSTKLLEQINSVEGGPFFQPEIEKDVGRLENFYLNQGLRGSNIKARVEEVGEGVYSVTFDIREGNRVKVEKIIVMGNSVTRKGTILKELRVKEGDYAFQDLIRETKRRLENLGVFEEVKIEEILLSSERENLIIQVREGKRNYASLGVGLETKNEPQVLSFWNNVIRPRLTAELIRSNSFGRASNLSLIAQVSLKEKRGVVSFEQPYFFGLPLQTFLNAWIEREERKSYSYDRRGISMTTIKSFSKDIRLFSTLRYTSTTLLDLRIKESEIDRQHFPFSTSSISGSFIWDTRDDPFNPQIGSFFSSNVEWAYPLFQTESNYLKIFLKYQNYISLFSRVTLSSTARLGLGRGRMPIHERFFAGGSHSFRGNNFDELGPRDPDSLKPIGGKSLCLINLEFTFPILSAYRDLLGAVFYDKGNVFAKRKDFSFKALHDALGFGLRYRTPLGPIRLELGWNLDAPKGEDRILVFVTLGNVF